MTPRTLTRDEPGRGAGQLKLLGIRLGTPISSRTTHTVVEGHYQPVFSVFLGVCGKVASSDSAFAKAGSAGCSTISARNCETDDW